MRLDNREVTALSSPTSASSAAPTPDQPIPFITLSRGGCLGTCPVYVLRIYGDGTVVYEGENYVKTKGEARSHIELKELKRLLAKFEEINYFSLKDKYVGWGDKDVVKEICPKYWSDYPTVGTSLDVNGQSKTVNHDRGCEGTDTLRKLTELEDSIDKAVNSIQWTGAMQRVFR